ncbi:uncharacterized protein LOC129592100 [Paramacrobiotus metropolitanus]|uniref:uncharacterized protein LOC129592100 n=1 Tax=Paramacrobiotus metropolitanus TaxID=2943436 RepID=UPI002445BCE2|nr:uncharacterized protein LOC129592100 [Paramacrobiotus metropolitanus]
MPPKAIKRKREESSSSSSSFSSSSSSSSVNFADESEVSFISISSIPSNESDVTETQRFLADVDPYAVDYIVREPDPEIGNRSGVADVESVHSGNSSAGFEKSAEMFDCFQEDGKRYKVISTTDTESFTTLISTPSETCDDEDECASCSTGPLPNTAERLANLADVNVEVESDRSSEFEEQPMVYHEKTPPKRDDKESGTDILKLSIYSLILIRLRV